MAINIPKTPEELCEYEWKGNPVVIAGYGRESTHKGYLSWILTSGLNPIASDLLKALIDREDIKSTNCFYEQRIASHKIDLLIEIECSSGQYNKLKLPIELKADSGPSGDTQFPDMTKHISAQNDYLPGRVFCLGSSSVQDHEYGGFTAVTVEEIYRKWLPYYEKGPNYFKDWLAALSLELARKSLAQQLYNQTKQSENKFYDYGYRSYKHLMYYIYSNFREYLKQNGSINKWLIYDGGYNAVMNHSTPIDGWGNIESLKNVNWFFEFNDDDFCLKLHQGSNDPSAVTKWVGNCIEQMNKVDPNNMLKTVFKKGGSYKSLWPKIAAWKVSFENFKIVHNRITEIMNLFGQNGVLGEISKA